MIFKEKLTMTSAEIRKTFLDFFASKGHKIVPSAPLVIKNDPTLMFTNAGMNQFKDYFLGNKPAVNKRIADTQKCLRVSGKHNDLEEVGIDTYHHTMFEMLGNWSFGDYFKKEAIEWAWELLTEVYKLPKDRLYVTVFEGDEKENLAFDQEAFDYWANLIEPSRILKGNKKDNFWEMGDTGPCGPCTEIHIDLRSEEEILSLPGDKLVNESHPQVIEIWNNVFMEFNRLANGTLQKLPAQHVDTGMGFERLCMAIQGKTSNYDTDVFQPTITFLSKETGVLYGASEKTDIAMRVLADHIRAVAFTIADGQLPSNNKAGYVIRRILRRAVRYYYNFLNTKEPLFYKLVAIIANQFADVFPELKAQEAFVSNIIKEEELSFLRTLESGLKRLNGIIADNNKVIDGKIAFELFDTYGFPYDLTALIARENNIEVDEDGFKLALDAQKQRSRNATQIENFDWEILIANEKITFTGYDSLAETTRITRYRKVVNKGQIQFQIVLETTPFYAESGGQVGDTGTISLIGSSVQLEVIDTKKENDLIIHIIDDEEAENLLPLMTGEVLATVNKINRKKTSANHTATHLLHAALRNKLGKQVQQKGSLVNSDALRFDFSHFTKITKEELAEISNEVNAKVRENIALEEIRDASMNTAQEMGAMALFGEKYGDKVRIIIFDRNYSVELCGGTHLKNTGEIGSIVITSESSISAGVRRIEALTGEAALAYLNEKNETLNEISALLKNPQDTLKSVESLLEEKSSLLKQIEQFQLKELNTIKNELLKEIETINLNNDSITYLAKVVSVPNADSLKKLAYDLKAKQDNLIAVLGADLDGKPSLAIIIDEALVSKFQKLNASSLVKEIAKDIQGGGGGQAFFATAGGKNSLGLSSALDKAKSLVLKAIEISN